MSFVVGRKKKQLDSFSIRHARYVDSACKTTDLRRISTITMVPAASRLLLGTRHAAARTAPLASRRWYGAEAQSAGATTSLTVRDALNTALDEELARDETRRRTMAKNLSRGCALSMAHPSPLRR